MRAGPEISVAATKSFIAQMAVLMQIINQLSGRKCGDMLSHAHQAIEEVLLMDVSEAVTLCKSAQSIFYVGRGPFYPVSLEGALKMKEISYIHAEGYAAGELKHGPFALLSPKTPVIAICMPGETYGVMISNIKEMKARGAPVIGIGNEGDTELPGGSRYFYCSAPYPSLCPGADKSGSIPAPCLLYRSSAGTGC